MSSIIAFTGKARSGKDTSCSIVKNILEDEYGYNVAVMAFADNLKLSASKIFDLTWNDLYGETKETPQVFDLSYYKLMPKVTEAMEFTFKDERYHMDFKLLSELTGRLIMELKKVAKPTLLTRLGLSEKYKFSSRQIQQIWGTEVVRKVMGNRFWSKDLEKRMVRFFDICSLRNEEGVVLISDLRFDSEAEWLSRFTHQTIEVKRDNVDKVSSHVSENGISTKYERDIIHNNGTLADLESKLRAIMKI
ncbi:deoxynucleotide monophosphate kinase [Salmonella phage BPS17L1]|uniref:Deoxynucleotide monophosphate kinase n=1 Tax=Salmonella phage BPS17L1 TaxID=2060122 RepID=A0A2I6PHK4_9CAUD|nr:deoxynucleotide monophosphate kinase [Salmonella phage BPS17L1]AUM59532.1 deoxynucleotide monophosphate kinase [Salmonella phage BPS17L1]